MKCGENSFSYTWIRFDIFYEILTQWNKQLEDFILLPIEFWNYVKSGCDSHYKTVFLCVTRIWHVFGLKLLEIAIWLLFT